MLRRGCLTPICHAAIRVQLIPAGRTPVCLHDLRYRDRGQRHLSPAAGWGFQLWATNPRPGWRRRHPTRGFWHRHQQFSGEWFGRGVLRRSGVSTHPDQRPEHRRLHYKCSHRSRQRRTGIAFPMANAPRCAARQRLAPCVAAAYILRTDVGTFPALDGVLSPLRGG